MTEGQRSTTVTSVGVHGCSVLFSGHLNFLPAPQQGLVAHPCPYSQGVLVDQEDLGDREDRQVQPGPGHPDKIKKQQQHNIVTYTNI